MDTIPEELSKEFMAIVARGDEQAARDFLAENISRFPKEARDEIIFAFFEDGVGRQHEADAAVDSFIAEGTEAMGNMDAAERMLEDKKKALDIKEDIAKN